MQQLTQLMLIQINKRYVMNSRKSRLEETEKLDKLVKITLFSEKKQLFDQKILVSYERVNKRLSE